MTERTSFVIKNNIPKVVKNLSDAQLDKLGGRIGAHFERLLVTRIKEGDPGWAPLSEAWEAQKGHGRQWYHTGRLEGAIEYKVDKHVVYIGIIDGGEQGKVAHWLEFGTSKIPARPLFRPIYHENEKEIVKMATEWVKEQVSAGRI
jgi:hypothetical protein